MQGQSFIGVGVALGVAVGAAIGVAMNNLAVGVGVGAAIGAGLGLAIDAGRRKEGSGADNSVPLDGRDQADGGGGD